MVSALAGPRCGTLNNGSPEAAWVFMDWLKGGLRQANLFASRDHAAEERRIEAAVVTHGSIVAALRAGVI